MLFARIKKLDRKIWILAGAVLLLSGAVVFWLAGSPTASDPLYRTLTIERGPLTASVEADGTVRAGQSAVLTWQTSGRVESVGIQLGERVGADQLLASLAASSLPKNVLLAESDLQDAKKSLDQLDNSNLGQAQAMQSLANAKQAVKDAQDRLDYLIAPRASAELLKDLDDQISQARDRLKSLQWLYDHFYAHLWDGSPKKAAMQVNLTNAKLNLDSAIARYNWFNGHPSEYSVEKAQAALDLAIAHQADAQQTLDGFQRGTNPDDLTAAQARVNAAKATLSQAELRAPFIGIITQSVPQPGDRVSAGDVAFKVEDLTHLLVDLQISEMDINSVMVDQPVEITFEAAPGNIYHGVVSSVDLASDEKQGVVNYAVVVRLSDADEQVRPGMSAAVMITTRSIESTLVVPNRAIRLLDGQKIVYVLRDGQPVALVIRVGAVTDTESEVVGGSLKVGDQLILNPPATASANSTPLP